MELFSIGMMGGERKAMKNQFDIHEDEIMRMMAILFWILVLPELSEYDRVTIKKFIKMISRM